MPTKPVHLWIDNDDNNSITIEEDEEEEDEINTSTAVAIGTTIDNNDEELLHEDDDEEQFYSLTNPAFVDDDDEDETIHDEWNWLQEIHPSDLSRSPTPPTPPPRSSSITTPTRKEITIVVHLVSSPVKSPSSVLQREDNSSLELPSTSSSQSNNINNFDLVHHNESTITATTIEDHTNIFSVPDLLCQIRTEGCFNSLPPAPSPLTCVIHEEERRQRDKVISNDETTATATATQQPSVRSDAVSVQEETSQQQQQTDMLSTTTTTQTQQLPIDYHQLQTQSDNDEDDNDDNLDSGFIPRFVRASMRRVRRFRLSTRQSRIQEEASTPVTPDESPADTTQSTILDTSAIEITANTSLDEVNRDFSVRHARNNDDGTDEESSEISSTTTDRISESVPELPPPRQRRESPARSGRDDASSPRPLPSPLGTWPHDACFFLAALGCTAGLFNICRFAVLCLQFGGPFLLQFLLLSVLFGIPLFLFHVALGHYLGAGVMDMWRISPVFQGVGIALLAGQALIGLYSIVGVSWLFIYFRDSFVTRLDNYKWAQPFPLYRGENLETINLSITNSTAKLEETVPDYFSGVVLQRYNLSSPDRSFGHFKFQVAFNLAVVWMIVFVSLSKGLKSYGKVVYVFVPLAVLGLFVLSCHLFRMAATTHQPMLPDTVWSDFVTNNQSWIAAATETFFTWGLMGIASLQAASQVSPGAAGRRLLRDSLFVALATLILLVFVAFLANACNELLLEKNYLYLHTSSFEYIRTAQFLRPVGNPRAGVEIIAPMPARLVPHSSLLAGQRLVLPGSSEKGRRPLSGYQALRLATELLPATFAAMGIKQVSIFWSILAYLSLILFGIAQQLAVWHSVITGIIAINARSLKSWETTITFFTCAFGYILGLPLTTELGIWVVYFLDTVVGSGWWLTLLHCLLLVAVLVVRGRPYNGETLANSLIHSDSDGDEEQEGGRNCCGISCTLKTWLCPLLSFIWSVVLPVMLLILSVILFRTSESGELYDWSSLSDRLYWPVWARELGSILQLLPVLVVPLVAMVQTCRYLANGPPDLFDRIELLYRPAPWGARQRSSTDDLFASLATDTASTPGNGGVDSSDDPPPKYTPPPSYTTATGARIAKLLRESIRRSMRRLAAPSTSGATSQTSTEHLPPPPDYASVLIEMRRSAANGELPRNLMTAQEVAQILRNSFRRTREQNRPVSSELLEIRPSQASQTLPARSKTLTAPEVAQILRSGSLRRSRRFQQQTTTSNNNESENSTTINLHQDLPTSSHI